MVIVVVVGDSCGSGCMAHFTAGPVKMKEAVFTNKAVATTQPHHTNMNPILPHKNLINATQENTGAKLPSLNVFNPLPVGFAGR